MPDNDWYQALEVLYDGPLYVMNKDDRGGDFMVDLIEYLGNQEEFAGHTEEELRGLLVQLDQADLITSIGVGGGGLKEDDGLERWGGLTGKGFDVVHERRMADQQADASAAVGFFTLVLAAASILQLAPTFYEIPPVDRFLLFLAVLPLVYLLYRGFDHHFDNLF